MAETFTLNTGIDAWVSSSRNGRFGDQRLFVYSGTYAYLYLNKPTLPAGAVVTNAKLVVYPVTTAVATVVPLTVHRLTSAFDPNSLTWSNLPTVGAQVGTTSRQWYPSGGPAFEIDLTSEVQALVNGQAWFGWRLSSTGTNVEQAIWGSQSANPPSLVVTYTVPPTAPTDLWPAGNGTVTSSRPVLTWLVPGGLANTQMSYQVQVAADINFTTSLYTSNEVTSGSGMADLSTISPAFTALTTGQSRYWRVRIRNDMGVLSAYSAAAQFTYTPAPSLTITAPAGSTTNDNTPTLTWTFGTTMAAYQVFVEIAARVSENRAAGVIYDSGIQYSSTASFTIPQGVFRYVSPQLYRIRLRVWASGSSIISTSRTPTYVEVTKDLGWVPSGLASPTQVLVTQPVAPMPWWFVRWEYTNATLPTDFAIMTWRNGKLQTVRYVNAAANREGATNWYNTTLYDIKPRASMTFEVQALKPGTGTSSPNPQVTIELKTLMPAVMWTEDPQNRRFALLNATIDHNLTEQSDVVSPVTGDPILVNWKYGKMMGHTSGIISWDAPLDAGSFNAENMFEDFLWMRQSPSIYFVWLDNAIRAYMYNATFKSIGRSDGRTDYRVDFDWFQVGGVGGVG